MIRKGNQKALLLTAEKQLPLCTQGCRDAPVLPTPPGPGSRSHPPHLMFSLLFYFFPMRAIENNPSKERKRANKMMKRKSANKMMKRHWQQPKGGRESVGVNAGMMKRASLPFGNRTMLINSPVYDCGEKRKEQCGDG